MSWHYTAFIDFVGHWQTLLAWRGGAADMPAYAAAEAGVVGGVTNGVIYAALKAALAHYTRCLAATLRTEGVRVNAVSPGATKTARFKATRVVDPKMMDSAGKSFVRYGEPEEIADAVAFLAGPRSRFINGQVLRVDGGQTLFPG